MTLKSQSKDQNEAWIAEIRSALEDLKKAKSKSGLVSYPMFPKQKNKSNSSSKGFIVQTSSRWDFWRKREMMRLRSGWCTRLFVLTKVAILFS